MKQNDRKPVINEAVSFGELWRIQESLLQTYRVIFITLQSLLLAIGVFLLSGSSSGVLLSVPVVLLGLLLVPVWMGVCDARANAVVFVHWLMQRYEAGEAINQPYSHFRQFQKDRTYAGINLLEDQGFRSLCESTTRKRLDVSMPRIFSLMWVLLLLVAALSGLVAG